MDFLSIMFFVVVLGVVGFAWAHLRSNWRSVQSMRANGEGTEYDVGFDLPEGLDGSHHQGHGHDCAHHGGDVGGHDSGGIHGGDHGGFDGGGAHH